MKKTYLRPQIKEVVIKAKHHLLTVSGAVGATRVRMSWDDDATDGEEGL